MKEFRFFSTMSNKKAEAWLNSRYRMGYTLEWRDFTLLGVRYVVSRPFVDVNVELLADDDTDWARLP
jgi:hypothetical protein